MYTTSQAYKDAISKNTREFHSRITMGGVVVEDDDILSFKITGGIQSSDYFMIGATVSQRLNITFFNESLTVLSDKDPIKVEIGPRLESGEFEYVPIGIFNIDDIAANDTTTSVVCFDNMLNLEIPHGAQGAESVEAILARITQKTGVSFETPRPEIANTVLKFNISQEEGLNCRDVLSYICSYFFANAVINRQGEIKIVEYKTFTPEVTLGMNDYKDYKNTNIEYVLGKIECQTNRETILEYGEDSDTTKKLQFRNPVMTQERLIYGYNLLRENSYVGFTVEFAGDPSIDVGDIIQLNKKTRTGHVAPILSQEYNYNGGLSFKLKSSGEGKNDNLNIYKPFDSKLREYDRRLNDLDPRIEDERDRIESLVSSRHPETIVMVYPSRPGSGGFNDSISTPSPLRRVTITLNTVDPPEHGLDYTIIDWGDGDETLVPCYSGYGRYHEYDENIQGGVLITISGLPRNELLIKSRYEMDIVRFGTFGNEYAEFWAHAGIGAIKDTVPYSEAFPKRRVSIRSDTQNKTPPERELILPVGLYSRLRYTEDFSYALTGHLNLKVIPRMLFIFNTKATYFREAFSCCPEITHLPDNLFSHLRIQSCLKCFSGSLKNIVIKDMVLNLKRGSYGMFECSGVVEIQKITVNIIQPKERDPFTDDYLHSNNIFGVYGGYPLNSIYNKGPCLLKVGEVNINFINESINKRVVARAEYMFDRQENLESIGSINLGDRCSMDSLGCHSHAVCSPTGTCSYYTSKLSTVGPVKLGLLSSGAYMFADCDKLKSVHSVSYHPLKNQEGDDMVIEYNYFQGMFKNCKELEYIGAISNFKEMRSLIYMFNNCAKLKSVLFTSGFAAFSSTFTGCLLLERVLAFHCSVREEKNVPKLTNISAKGFFDTVYNNWPPFASKSNLNLPLMTNEEFKIGYMQASFANDPALNPSHGWTQGQIDTLNRVGWAARYPSIIFDGLNHVIIWNPHPNNWKNYPSPI